MNKSKNCIIKCQMCMGGKKLMGLGMIFKDCSDCTGLGWVIDKTHKKAKKKKCLEKKVED